MYSSRSSHSALSTMMASDWAVAEFQQMAHAAQHALLVLLDLLGRQDQPRLVLAGGIARLGGAAAHQQDGPVAGLLQPAQGHQLHQIADMHGLGGAVEADIGGDALAPEQGVQFGAAPEQS